eukprot:PhF_6_TR40768/c0_g1_i2/m.61464
MLVISKVEVRFDSPLTCSISDLIIGFQFLLGMVTPEHERPDRNMFIQIDTSAAEFPSDFDVSYARMYGVFDATSIFQEFSYYGSAVGDPTMYGATNEQLGRRSTLSPVDVQRVNFIHNNCSIVEPQPVVPNCDVSLSTTIPTILGYSQSIDVQMVCMSNTTTGGVFANDRCGVGLNNTCVIKSLQYAYSTGYHQHWQWTPSVALSGQSVVMTLTFANAVSLVNKRIPFTVLASAYACFGLAATDPTVCSGHGNCVSNGVCRCTNTAYTGPHCNLSSACPFDTVFDFESSSNDWNGLMTTWDADIVSTSSVPGGKASLEVYEVVTFTYSRQIQQLEWYTYLTNSITTRSSPHEIVLEGMDTAFAVWMKCVTLVPISSGRWNLTIPIQPSSTLPTITTTSVMASRLNRWIPIRINTDWSTYFNIFIDYALHFSLSKPPCSAVSSTKP